MNSTLAPVKFFLLLIAGLLLVILLDSLTPARSQPSNGRVVPAPVAIAPDLSAFDLSASLEPLIPAGLAQSDNPNEGGRGIIGRDDRLPVTSRSYPWSAIGRVEILDDGGHCTGTLISLTVVLTNSHCVVNPQTHQPYQRFAFQPNLIDGQLQDEADWTPVEAIFFATDFRTDNQPPNAEDWALLELSYAIGEEYGTLGLAPLSLSELTSSDYQGKLMMVGYSGDFPADNPGLTAGFHSGCSILGETEGSFIHNCDTTGGSSGGPILAVMDDETWIVALNSAESTKPSGAGIENYAVNLTLIVEQVESDQAD